MSWKSYVDSIIHQISIAAGLGIIIYAGLSDGDVWNEFFQYFRESKFVSTVDVLTYDIHLAQYGQF